LEFWTFSAVFISIILFCNDEEIKVMTVVGTRPEIIRLSRVLSALDASEAVEHIIVHTGQNYDYELNQIFFEDLGLRNRTIFSRQLGNQLQRQ
jgi:UDP-N-acetylglucosamine 2-epimerase (non-hydrolysing)